MLKNIFTLKSFPEPNKKFDTSKRLRIYRGQTKKLFLIINIDIYISNVM